MLAVTQNAEKKLIDTIGKAEIDATNWRALYFRFDQLLERYANDYQLKISVNLLSDLFSSYQGGIFVCHDNTIIVVCRNAPKNQIEKAIFQLRYLFIDDPLTYDAEGKENKNFCRVYDLGVEYAEIYQICRQKLSHSLNVEKPGEAARQQSGLQEKHSNESAFTPLRLSHIEHDLYKADLSRILRMQPICAVTHDNNLRKVFDEYYINIAKLRQMLHTKADLLGNRWLFGYLTQILDERMLDMLSMSPLRYFETPVSLNFNIETILSPKFKEFDSLIKPVVKFSVLIEIQVGDVFSDIKGFTAARNLLHKLGYKVCIDGLNNLTINLIDRDKLDFDLAKIQWSPEMGNHAAENENSSIINSIKSCGANRVILCRCDTRDAISYGQSLGINLFQGRYLDRMLNPNSKNDN
ncbi:MAG: hypothetical protein WCL30_01665 [Pseudomonadota bacterium]